MSSQGNMKCEEASIHDKAAGYREYYELGRKRLEAAKIDEAALDARLLLEHVCHSDRNALLVHGDREVEPQLAEQYLELIAKRCEHIPLQHLTGYQDFMGLTFKVSDKVLIPRQDTEILVEEVMKELHDGMRILDMCTGSGCILISLLHYSNDCQGVGADISREALAVAEENACRILGRQQNGEGKPDCTKRTVCELPSEHVALPEEISLIYSDLFEQIEGKFDLIVSNPPYIRTDVIATLMPEVRDHEPVQALDGLADGLHFYRKIIEESRGYLQHGGMLYFEIGFDQAQDVSRLMEEAGFVEIKVVQDYAGLDRVVYGTHL